MVLTNGQYYSISTDVATPTGTSTTSRFCYDSDSITVNTFVKVYVNSTLVHTSTNINSGTFYPYAQCDAGDDPTQETPQKLEHPSSLEFTWTITQTPISNRNIYVGFNANTSGGVWGTMSLSCYSDHGSWTYVREGTTTYEFDNITAQAGDVIKIVFAVGQSGTGTRLPPPPLIARF